MSSAGAVLGVTSATLSHRYILLQFLVLFQYLKSQVKFKTDLQSLDSAQSKTVEDMQTKVYRLLGETPPNGPDFARSVKRMLGREEAWNKWKNDGCPRYSATCTITLSQLVIPSLAKKLEETGEAAPRIGEGGSSRRKKRRLGDLGQVP